jgi:type IV secretion system protein VirD4
MDLSRNLWIKLAAGIALSFVGGLVVASLYVDAHSQFGHGANGGLGIFSFIHTTPLSRGYSPPLFHNGLMIIGFTMAFTGLVMMVVIAGTQNHHGTAHWAGFIEMHSAGYFINFDQITGPLFGKTMGPHLPGHFLSSGPQPHSLVVAPTRAGKGVGVVIPTLLTFPGSVLALDVKGELFELTSRARAAQGHKIFKFAPFDAGGRSHSYNPLLDLLQMPENRRFSEARRLAVNLIVAKGKGAEGFLEGARDLFVAGILACIERGTPTIGDVYDLFTQPGEKYRLFARLAEETRIPEVRRIFDNMAATDTKILTSYTSVLGDGGLNLWADPLIRAATSRSDFSIYELRRTPSTIYLCVSPNDLEVIAPVMRLLFQQVVSILQRTLPDRSEQHEVLLLLDEFKHLGKMEAVETAVTTIAGYKGRFMFIIQSLSALTGAYGQPGKENFLSNTGVQVFMATADDETPNYISKAIGDYSYRAKSVSYSRAKLFDTNYQISEQGANLIRPEQIRLLDDSTEIVLIKGMPPLKLKKIKYYEDRILRPIFESQQGPLPEPDVLVPISLVDDKSSAPSVRSHEASSGGPDLDVSAPEPRPEAPASELPPETYQDDSRRRPDEPQFIQTPNGPVELR